MQLDLNGREGDDDCAGCDLRRRGLPINPIYTGFLCWPCRDHQRASRRAKPEALFSADAFRQFPGQLNF